MELLCALDVTDAETSDFGLNIFLNCQSIRISRASASGLNAMKSHILLPIN
jgi:hypothetical protein